MLCCRRTAQSLARAGPMQPGLPLIIKVRVCRTDGVGQGCSCLQQGQGSNQAIQGTEVPTRLHGPEPCIRFNVSRLQAKHRGRVPDLRIRLPKSSLASPTSYATNATYSPTHLHHLTSLCIPQDACHLWVCLSRVGVSRKALATLRDATLAVLAAHVGVLRGHLDGLPEALFAGEDFRRVLWG